jgi:small subunit ribosomal protein S20
VPTIKSAKKAMRKSRTRYHANRAKRSTLRTALKRVRTATSAEEAARAYKIAVRLLDRAARRRLIHPNSAARHKSRLAAVVKQKTSK